MMSDVDGAPDENPLPEPISPTYTGPKPGDRPLPNVDNSGRDLDAEEAARRNIIRHDEQDDQNKSDESDEGDGA